MLRAPAEPGTLTVALAGNPNSGKTTVFNALTGLHHKVGNYPGVTVERRTGTCRLGPGTDAGIVDLPGAYSLFPRSPDEEIARRVILGEQGDIGSPDLIILVVDASNLERNLYFAAQIFETGIPVILGLNMMDVAEARGLHIDVRKLASSLDVPVVPLVANRGTGIDALRKEITTVACLGGEPGGTTTRRRAWLVSPEIEAELASVSALLKGADRGANGNSSSARDAEALRLVGPEGAPERIVRRGGDRLLSAVERARHAVRSEGLDTATFETEGRYRWIKSVVASAVSAPRVRRVSRSDRADAVLTHRLAGPLIFIALLALIFYSVFAWAAYPMDWIDSGLLSFGGMISGLLPDGPIRSLVVDGVLGGVGAILVFLPQIVFLFFFIGLLEDTGYMARAAFMMDRVMRQFGFPGKACIPLMSSFACAIPGIMAARTIENRKDRMVTILVAPLMSCSARLPVYTLVIGAFIPGGAWTRGVVMTGLYLLGVVVAVGAASVLKRTAFRGPVTPLLMELPPYRRPHARTVLYNMLDRARLFIANAGTVILAVSVILWFLSSYPKPAGDHASAESSGEVAGLERTSAIPGGHGPRIVVSDPSALAIRESFAGRIGRFMEPAIEPLGFDWKIGIGLLTSFAAREVFVSTMGTVYGVGDVSDDPAPLAERLRTATWDSGPRAGMPIYTLPVALALLVFYVLACQCASTLAVVKRETNSWRWPIFMWTYMTLLAYAGAWIAYRVAGHFA